MWSEKYMKIFMFWAVVLLILAVVLSIICTVKLFWNGSSGSGISSISSSSSPTSNFVALSSNLGAGVAQSGIINWNPTGTTVFNLDDDRGAFSTSNNTTFTTWAAGSYLVETEIWGTVTSANKSTVILNQLVNGVSNNAFTSEVVSNSSTSAAGVQMFLIQAQRIHILVAAGSTNTFELTTDNSAVFDLQGGGVYISVFNWSTFCIDSETMVKSVVDCFLVCVSFGKISS